MKGIITVDIGTTNMKAILHDADGLAVFVDQRETIPVFACDGRVEQDPVVWKTLLAELLRGCSGFARDRGIEALCVAVTAQRSSVIPVDSGGTPLHPAIMWQDRRTADLARSMDSQNPWVYAKTGLKVSPVFSALKMTWLRRNRPDVWNRTHKMLGVQDWALYLLTGRFVTDETFASRTDLFDLEKRAWDPGLLELFEVEPRMLCELVAPGSVVGGLTREMAAATGLASGLPVVSSGGDQQCAALGLGLFSGDRAVSNTGTGSYLIGHADAPAFDAGMRLACNVSAVPGAYIVEAAVLTSGTIYRWFKDSLFEPGNCADDPFERLNAEAGSVPPGANGLILLPHFQGSGAPYWDPGSKGAFFNVTLNTSRGEMARAILEGIAIEMKESLELVERLCGTVRSVSVSGGMTKSALFNQIQSDIFDRPVVRPTGRAGASGATSLGAWIAGAVAMGLQSSYPSAFSSATGAGAGAAFAPDPANRETYGLKRRRSRALYEALAAPEFREWFA